MKRASLRACAGPLGVVAPLAGLTAPACGAGSSPPIFTGDPPPGPPANDGGTPVLTAGCSGFQCSVGTCPNSGTTSISGTVYNPAGSDPLYNVVVYVPASPPDPITTGATCDSCSSLYTGGVVAAAITDATGSFSIKNAPAGNSIPLVVQIGKWRKQTSVASVTSCADNSAGKLTLPSSSAEGDIPNIAISTGGADSLECLLLRIGIAPTEYMPGAAGPGRIHIFQGSAPSDAPTGAATTEPAAPLSSVSLWDSIDHLLPYDITVLSCEGAETVNQPGSLPLKASDQENLLAYTAAGGRVFASHFHYAWFNTGPFGAENIATWTTGANSIVDSSVNTVSNTFDAFINADIVTTFADGGSFPKGQVLDQWLATVDALNPAGQVAAGQLRIDGARHNADLIGLVDTPSQAWILANASAQSEIIDGGTPVSAAGATEYLSFNTPVDAGENEAGVPAYCGRVVYSDLHVGAASGDYEGQGAGGIVPEQCANNPLSPQEKALEFMLFDLSSCVTPDNGTAQQPVPGPLQ